MGDQIIDSRKIVFLTISPRSILSACQVTILCFPPRGRSGVCVHRKRSEKVLVEIPPRKTVGVHRPLSLSLLQKGDFVLEKKDLTKYDSYPIWKIDAGRLLQKYESVVKDGRMLHKAMSTVSTVPSPFQSLKPKFPSREK